MTLWERILIFFGIKSETEINRREEIERRVLIKEIERDIMVSNKKVATLEAKALSLEKSGRHAEALSCVKLAGDQKKTTHIAEMKLMKCQSALDLMEAGRMMADNFERITRLAQKTMGEVNAAKITEAKFELDESSEKMEETANFVKSVLNSFETDFEKMTVDEEAENALARIMAEHTESIPAPVVETPIKAEIPAQTVMEPEPTPVVLFSDKAKAEFKQPEEEPILAVCE